MNGQSLAPILADRRVWLFALVAALSAAAGFVLIPDQYAMTIVSSAGYWCVLAAFLLFARSLWETYRADLAGLAAGGLGRVDWASHAVVAIGGTALIVTSPSASRSSWTR